MAPAFYKRRRKGERGACRQDAKLYFAADKNSRAEKTHRNAEAAVRQEEDLAGEARWEGAGRALCTPRGQKAVERAGAVFGVRPFYSARPLGFCRAGGKENALAAKKRACPQKAAAFVKCCRTDIG